MYWSNQQKRLTKWLGLCEKILGKTDGIHYNIRGNPKQLIKKKKKKKIKRNQHQNINNREHWTVVIADIYFRICSLRISSWSYLDQCYRAKMLLYDLQILDNYLTSFATFHYNMPDIWAGLYARHGLQISTLVIVRNLNETTNNTNKTKLMDTD